MSYKGQAGEGKPWQGRKGKCWHFKSESQIVEAQQELLKPQQGGFQGVMKHEAEGRITEKG